VAFRKEAILFWMPQSCGFSPFAWREDDAPVASELDLGLLVRMMQTAERGKIHGAFFADGVAVGFGPAAASAEALSRTAKGSRFEPLTLLSALSASTRHIGLLGTLSTTVYEPYNVARMFGSLDHISGGRAGWNVVTTAHPKASLNFGVEELMNHAERYERGQEFVEIVTGLWDSWEDDAFLRDAEAGLYFDPAKLHALNYRGKHLSCAGPLNMARPPQGYPLIAQAGASKTGSDFAARNADVIYSMHADMEQARDFLGDIKERAAAHGRDPDHVKVLPGLTVLVGRSQAHADEKLARLRELVDPIAGMEQLEGYMGVDLSAYPLDGPVPDIPETANGARTIQRYYLDRAKRDNLTLRQLMQLLSCQGVTPMTATGIADRIQEWMEAGAADGFNITFGDVDQSLNIFVEDVVPELQRRGLFQTEYRGRTLRENLGLPRPRNRLGVAA